MMNHDQRTRAESTRKPREAGLANRMSCPMSKEFEMQIEYGIWSDEAESDYYTY